MASTQRVFAVSELLESVLQYIPERDLLLFQRVNQTFRNVIKHSPQLQRKLFYTADVYQEGDLLRKLKWNPLLNIFHSYKISNYSIERSAACGTWERWRELNQSNQLSLEDFIDVCSPGFDLEALRKANYSTASWKNMHFTQPALGTMTMDREYSGFDDPGNLQLTQIHTDIRGGVPISHYRRGKVSCVWESRLRLR